MTEKQAMGTYFDPKKFMWASATFASLMPVFAIWLFWQTGNELALWFGFAFFYALVPLCENLFGLDTHNPPREAIGPLRDDKFYSWIVFSSVPLIYFLRCP
jgi:alkane 1-monooxygenase